MEMSHDHETKLDLLIKTHFNLAQRAKEEGNRYIELHFFESGVRAAIKLNDYGRYLRKE